jgi:hypothetical protein
MQINSLALKPLCKQAVILLIPHARAELLDMFPGLRGSVIEEHHISASIKAECIFPLRGVAQCDNRVS